MTQIATYAQTIPALTARVPVVPSDTAALLAALIPSASADVTTVSIGGAKGYGTEFKLASLTVPRDGIIQVTGNVAVAITMTNPADPFLGGFFMNIFLGATAVAGAPNEIIAAAVWFSNYNGISILGGSITNPRIAVTAGQILTLGGQVLNTNGNPGTWIISDHALSSNVHAHGNNFAYNYIG